MENILQDIIKQITPPPYGFKVRVSGNSVYLQKQNEYSVDHIDKSDPIVKLLIDYAINLQSDPKNKTNIIAPTHNWQHNVRKQISNYLISFLNCYMPQKNPKVTKLYRWMNIFSRGNFALSDSEFYDTLQHIYKYICLNIHKPDKQVHIKNGIALLEVLKTKYENKGHKVEKHHVRYRRKKRR